MNGDDKKEIVDTFRYELGQVFAPVQETLKKVDNTLDAHIIKITRNETEIGTLKERHTTLSGRMWAMILGVPTLFLIVVGILTYLS